MKIRIATRQSPLALAQTNMVKQQLLALDTTLTIEIIAMKTEGDIKLDTSLAKIGGKGLFLKELETALLDGRADVAVHSMKDVPMQLPEGLQITAMLAREDCRDVFISERYKNFSDLPDGAVVGTSSLRRQSQLLALKPSLEIKTLRGNVQTRLRKLKENEYDAIILAAAGLNRLELSACANHYFDVDDMLPAVGQGAVGIESRVDDDELNPIIRQLADHETTQCLLAERGVSRYLNASCHWPLAALAELSDGTLSLSALVGATDGSRLLAAKMTSDAETAEQLGVKVAKMLVEQGAKDILDKL